MPNDIKYSILTHFYQIGRAMRRHSTETLGAESLTMHQVQALFFVKHEQPIRMSQLAEELQISAGSATVLADRLVESGWLSRTQDPSDRRGIFLKVSDETTKKLDIISRDRMERAGKILDHLADTDLLELDRILKLLQDSL
jgi:DNA-binding MarR family transcriptional regulator